MRSLEFQVSAKCHIICDNRQRGWRKGNWEHICLCERLCGRRERERETASERERGEGGWISGGEDAHWECVADRGAERETSRCSADGKQQVSSQTPERVNGEREAAGGDSGEIQSPNREEGSDSPIPPLLVAVWTPDESKFAVVLLAGLQHHPDQPLRLRHMADLCRPSLPSWGGLCNLFWCQDVAGSCSSIRGKV